MKKFLFAFLVILDLAVLALLILGIIDGIGVGGVNIVFPGLGLIVALPFLLGVGFIIEMVLICITIILYRHLKNNSKRLI